jgi:isoquinoline 1-oxidoreductase alpha subunit
MPQWRENFQETSVMVPVPAQAIPISPDSRITPVKLRDGVDLMINGEHFRHTCQ